jgi:hypothetical protein
MMSRTVLFHQAAYSRRAVGAVLVRRPGRLAAPRRRRPIGPSKAKLTASCTVAASITSGTRGGDAEIEEAADLVGFAHVRDALLHWDAELLRRDPEADQL